MSNESHPHKALGAPSDPLRPARLDEFVGQPEVSRELGIIVSAAVGRDQLPDHLLLVGPPGTGKTTLAHIVAAEAGVPLVTTSGPALERPGDLAGLLTRLGGPSVVFIDEIHRLPRAVEEALYPAMEDQVLDLVIGDGAAARPLRLPLSPFCLVGATTQAGLLAAPLRDRFGFTARLRPYSADALAHIVSRSAVLLDTELAYGAAAEIAGRSRGVPRVANAWLRRVRDWAQVHDQAPVTAELAARALDEFGVDRLGLDAMARAILEAVCVTFRGGPVGLNALAATVGEAPETVEVVYEPYLARLGFLARTPRGRVATDAAYAHLDLSPATGQPDRTRDDAGRHP